MVNVISALPAKTLYLSSSNANFHNHISLPFNKKNNISRVKQAYQHICRAELTTELTTELAPVVTSTVFELAPATSAVYGALLLGGGFFAYTRSGSKGSLIGGASGGALMAAAYYLMQSPETKSVGDALGFGSAFLFSSVFVIRLVASKKLVPSGPLLGLSVGALLIFLSAYMQDKL